jgi:eRF1 domain 3
MALTEWFTDNYTRYGAQLEFVSDRSQEGSQFVKGFGGVGALLRFQLDVSTLDYDDEYFPNCVVKCLHPVTMKNTTMIDSNTHPLL